MTIDIEHILPKSKPEFLRFMFDPKNLSASCKRCNLSKKGTDHQFYSGPVVPGNPFVSAYYSIIHPNLDNRKEHLLIFVMQFDTMKLLKYIIVKDSEKGKATYEYFDLKELEISNYDEAQGMERASDMSQFSEAVRRKLEDILPPGAEI